MGERQLHFNRQNKTNKYKRKRLEEKDKKTNESQKLSTVWKSRTHHRARTTKFDQVAIGIASISSLCLVFLKIASLTRGIKYK